MAATLRHAGYDPVVLSGGERVLPSRLAVLHPVGQALFDQVVTDDPTSGRGVVRLNDAAEPGDGRLDGGPPVAVEAATFGTRLKRLVPDSAVREDGVRRLERERDVLRVRFESGVREWFDLVVVAGGPDSTVHGLGESSPETDPALQVETRVDGGHASLAPSRGVWTDEGLVQTFPHPDGGSLLRVTADPAATASPGSADDRSPTDHVRRALDALEADGAGGTSAFDGGETVAPATGGPAATAHSAVEATMVAQARPGGSRWADGRVARCGAAALPQAPATGLQATLALVDARVLADELVAGPASVQAALEAYGRRRDRHVSRLREAADAGWTDATGPADSDDSPLAWVGRYLSASRRASDALATTARI